MIRNYLKIAWRNLIRNKLYSFINIGGLALGLAVAMLIGLWLYDELTFDSYHQNHGRIAQVLRHQTVNGEVLTARSAPIPLATELSAKYGNKLRHVVLAWWTSRHTLSYGNQVFSRTGKFISPDAPEMLSLRMLAGSRNGLKDPASILLSESLARALFGSVNPLHQVLKINNSLTVHVTGVYEDLPEESSFADMRFMAPWDLYASATPWVKEAHDSWENTSFEIFVELAPTASFEELSAQIKNTLAQHMPDAAASKPELFLDPMSRWHLYSDWENGKNTGGRIQYLWLFGSIGFFVLLLACINFINLSTARSLNRAREVGIRKAVGSMRIQLVGQFLGESFLVAAMAYGLAVLLAWVAVPFFNQVADKSIAFPWQQPAFWLFSAGFALLTGILAGLYPALYLSSFQPIRVLTGAAGIPRRGLRWLAPRQVLVVVQFTVSIVLIIGTLVVFRQVQHARNRPLGYDRQGLITLMMNSPGYGTHREAIRQELIQSGSIVDMAESASPTTEVRSRNGGFDWAGKDPNLQTNFATTGITHEFGRTVGWTFTQGRDFSREFATDSTGLIINETAARFMGFQHPVGETVTWSGEDFRVSFQIVGVIEDMVMDSPYEPVNPSVFFIGPRPGKFITMRLQPGQSIHRSLTTIQEILKKHMPDTPFDYTFVDEEFDQKFRSEERTSQLSVVFSILAICISCLGLFGLATFMAEQRTREVGIRKVLGASVAGVVRLLSAEFMKLVLIAILIASPIAWYAMNRWLQDFTFRIELEWWYFVVAGTLALGVALLTVSYQSIKSALMNPVKSLRSE